ncbi:hypothetical protein EMPG_09933, partial [Blastomyces silverae]
MIREKTQKSITMKKQQQKKIENKTAEKKTEIEILFKFYICSMIKNIEKTALLSEYINLLITETKSEKVDQKMLAFEEQINLT